MQKLKKLLYHHLQREFTSESELNRLYRKVKKCTKQYPVELQKRVLDFLQNEISPLCYEEDVIFAECRSNELVERRADGGLQVKSEEAMCKIYELFNAVIQEKRARIDLFLQSLA